MTKKKKQQLARVRSFIRKAEKRGYVFSEEFKASLSSKTTRALQMLTPRRLYERSQYKFGTQLLPGMAGRTIERGRAATKARLTREFKKQQIKTEANLLSDALIPSIGLAKVDSSLFSEGLLIYGNLLEEIENFPASEGAEYLKNLLKSEIKTYGEDKVIAALAEMPEDVIRVARDVMVYAANSQQIHTALREFSTALRSGEAISKQGSKELNNVMESMTNAY